MKPFFPNISPGQRWHVIAQTLYECYTLNMSQGRYVFSQNSRDDYIRAVREIIDDEKVPKEDRDNARGVIEYYKELRREGRARAKRYADRDLFRHIVQKEKKWTSLQKIRKEAQPGMRGALYWATIVQRTLPMPRPSRHEILYIATATGHLIKTLSMQGVVDLQEKLIGVVCDRLGIEYMVGKPTKFMAQSLKLQKK